MAVSFVWFDMGYTLLYMQRETTYQLALRNFDIEVPLADIEREFHLTDKLFMREYPGFFLEPHLDELTRPYSKLGLYALFAIAIITIISELKIKFVNHANRLK